jgi:hypothetical protein
MQFNDAVVVCTSTENSLEMFLSSYTCDGSLSNYGLYDSQNLENFVFNLNSANICSQKSQNLPSKISSSGCFTLYNIYSTARTNTTLLFRLKEVHSKNCAVNNVVKVLESINSTFSVSSDSAGSCELTILSAVTSKPIFGIKFTEIISSSNVIYTFKSPINQNKILDLKSSEIFNYLPLSLYTPALSIIIPSGKTLKFTATTFTDTITVTEARAVLAPPSYYGFAKYFSPALYSFNAEPGDNNFVVKQLNERWNVSLLYWDSAYNQYNYVYFQENGNITVSYLYRTLYADVTDVTDLRAGFLIDFTASDSQMSTTI